MDRKTIGARRHWNRCLHEAAHAVIHVRQGGKVDMVEVYENAKVADLTMGAMVHSDFARPAVLVAGHFSELKWGVAPVFRNDSWLSGCFMDMEALARIQSWKRGSSRIAKSDRKSARKVWQQETRKLRALVKRDSTFERQVRAVAKSLCFKGTLTGAEVLAILRAV